MSLISIQGVDRLTGHVKVHGSKNAVLPVFAAAMAVRTENIVLKGCPNISDAEDMLILMEHYGVHIERVKDTIIIDSSNICENVREDALFKKTRASVLMMSVLLSAFGRVDMPCPGGCVIGKRPVDEHIRVLQQFGADAICEEGNIEAYYINPKPAYITLNIRSVGATQNAIICAVFLNGISVINNAAIEPEILELCNFFNKCGAAIRIDRNSIYISGGRKLHSCEYEIMPDRIAAGTYAIAVAACSGDAVIEGFIKENNEALLNTLKIMGTEVKMLQGGIEIIQKNKKLKPVNVCAGVYPEYATDLQPQLIAALSCAKGVSRVSDKVFPDRFGICGELIKAGAIMKLDKEGVLIEGVEKLNACSYSAGDLRAGAGLCIAGLMAEGESTISGVEYIKRGYEDICRDLRELGAKAYMV